MKRLSLIVVILAVLAVFFTFQEGTAQVRGKDLYDLMGEDDLTTSTGNSRLTWLPDGQGYIEAEGDADNGWEFFKVNPKNQKRTPLFNKNTANAMTMAFLQLGGGLTTGMPFEEFEYVMDEDAIFFTVNDADYIFNLKNNKLKEMNRPVVERQPGTVDLMRNMSGSQLWNGTYSPDYKLFAYVKEYDIMIVDTETGNEEPLTTGGYEGEMNGRPSWVYPEELGQLDAYWFSPDSKKIAFLQYDEREVYQYPIIHELQPEARLELERYPKPGEPNPTVRLFIIDIKSKKLVEVETNASSDVYIIKPVWLDNGKELIFQRLNRRQDRLELLAADPKTGKVRTILTEKEDTFVSLHNDFNLLKDGKRFTWSSERTGWRHLYMYNIDGTLVKQLTDGEWEVSGISTINEKDKQIYFTAYMKTGTEAHFCRVKFDGSKFQQLTTGDGSHRVSIDPAGKFYVDTYSSLTKASVSNLHSSGGKLIRSISETDTGKLDALKLVPPEFIVFKANDLETDLHGILYKPADFDSNKVYPLIVSTYGGPSGGVRNSFVSDNRLMRLAQLGFIVLKQDNRGTTNRGKKHLAETYMKFGQVDVDDQAQGVIQISQRPYIDGTRVGMFGGSYGGYMTCMSMLRFPDIYHVGVAGSSVTDWRNYDTIYTERYMRTPQENRDGYEQGSALIYVKNLKGKLLLTHGSIDNNVHPGNTIRLVDALQKVGKEFDLMFYPEERHGIRGYHGEHRAKLQVSYFLKHLKPENWEESLKTIW